MSDGGISSDGSGAPPSAPSAPSGPSMSEQQAREVLTGLVDEHLNTRGFEGLDRLNARMDEMTDAQRVWLGSYDEGEGEDGYEPDVLDNFEDILADAVDRRFDAQEEAEQGELDIAEREYDFEGLRERMPMLQHEQTALAIVQRASDLCHAWEMPELIDSAAFVNVIEQVALASLADPRQLQPPAPAPSPAESGNGYGSRPVQLESASGAGHRQPPRSDQDRFMDYVKSTSSDRI